MGRNEFLRKLQWRLKGLPKQEIDSALQYYQEYFDDAGENEEQAAEELGSPAKIAAQILADYALEGKTEGSERRHMSNFTKVWIIILAIFASPIALPIALTVLVLLGVLVLTGAILLLSFFVTDVAVAFGGLYLLIAGVGVSIQSITTTLLFAGFGLAGMGIGVLLFAPILMLSKVFFRYIARLGRGFVRKFRAPAAKEGV